MMHPTMMSTGMTPAMTPGMTPATTTPSTTKPASPTAPTMSHASPQGSYDDIHAVIHHYGPNGYYAQHGGFNPTSNIQHNKHPASYSHSDHSHHDTMSSTDMMSSDMMSSGMASPEMVSPDMVSPDMTSADMTSADMTSADMMSADMMSSDMMSPDMASPAPSYLEDNSYHYHHKPDHTHGFIERNIYEAKDDLKEFFKEVKAAVTAEDFA